MRSHFLIVLVASLSLFACGSNKEGGGCATNGFLCADTTAALECTAKVWVKLPCKGIAGCVRTADVVKCDMSGNVEGDNCASTAKGRGLCTSDGKGTLECRERVSPEIGFGLVKTNTCLSCSVDGDQVLCSPP